MSILCIPDTEIENDYIIVEEEHVRCPPMETIPELEISEPTQEAEFIDLRGSNVLEIQNEPVIEGFSDMTIDDSKDDYKVQGMRNNINGVKYGHEQTQITRKFELVAKTNESNTAMNLLFGEGEFIFTKEKLNIFIMASLYTIGANLYVAKDADKVMKLHYNVYIGDSNKNLKGKLGEMKRSLDQRYKLELVSKSKDFIEFVAENSYIIVKLEDEEGTLRQTLLESFY